MTEQEAIKLVKKQNRQNRIENVKCWFSECGIPVLISILILIPLVVLILWPAAFDIYYGDDHPLWLQILEPTWIIFWLISPLIVLLILFFNEGIKDKKQKFKKQVQEELRIAKHREELAPKIEQWLVDHGYRNTDRYTITDIWLHEYRNVSDVNYIDKTYDKPNVNWYLCIDLDREEEEQEKDKQELLSSLSCALTHDIRVCEECKKCEGGDAAEIRINLMNKLKEMFGDK